MLSSADTTLDTNGYASIAKSMRDWIVDQDVKPGTLLPKQTELAERFEVSSLTIGRAMRELQDDGFVVAIRRAGTFIADAPPHLNRYALVFPDSAPKLSSNRFMQALANEAERLAEQRGITIDCVYGLDGNREREGYRQLVDDIERRRLAGILFTTAPFLLEKTPILNAPGVPRAAILPAQASYPNTARVTLSAEAFATRAFERLREAGRRRLAIITTPSTLESWQQLIAEQAPQYGLESRPYWLQAIDRHAPICARQLAHLLFSPEATTRPDALIVADDNILEEATNGLADAGVEAPGELSVIAHCNFPWPTPSRLPVERLGFDAHEILERMLEQAERQRAGERITSAPSIDPLFEEEFNARRRNPADHTLRDRAHPLVMS